MKKIEFVYRELLYQAIEKKNRRNTQLELSRILDISLSTVNFALGPLVRMNAVKINPRNLEVIDPKKILYYWASIRNLEKDIVYKTRVNEPVNKIESEMPPDIIFGAYSAYKFKLNDVPADYSEVYIYADEDIIKKRFEEKKIPNLFVLKKDILMDRYKEITYAQLFVDFWNIKEWYARDFLKALEEKINGILE
ncbi:MAG: winged helix-turn-helix transcriptional regulator [Nanoarchaeota archaeon]|nr:winged helix-turn-helix transcriptional regulator [Nanoarchaeota archaeon]MBU0963262.1 winged helix-turn-helix transcriptional regulator [Nanoarchaeota archaeon]